ncbi:MAG: PstS family phosphate ABC transporter substrate-binding protein [Phycisphaerales bacterium JB050]
MKKNTKVLASVATLGLGAVALAATAPVTGQVNIAGSSTVAPITIAVAEAFREMNPDLQIQNAITGTGGGFKRFTVGETDISNASRPIKWSEVKIARENGVEFIELPVAYDGLTFVVNKDNYWCEQLTVEDLKKLFLEGSEIKTWNDLNSNWPRREIKMFIPGTDSGTFDYFKEVVVGDSTVRSDVTVSEDDNILVNGVANEAGAIGFFGCAYYYENENKLKAVKIVNPDSGEAVAPTPEAIESGSYAPFSRPLFVYVNTKSAQRPEIRAFVQYYLENAGKFASEVGYVGLPQSVYFRAARNFRQGKTGTQFHDADGNAVKGSVTKVYR